jgi:membrane-associated phospholipid phosphatase
LLFSSSIIFAQNDTNDNNTCDSVKFINAIRSDLEFSYENSLNVFKSPYYFDSNDFLITGVIVALTVTSFTIDNSIRKSVIKNKNNLMNKVTSVGENFGNAKYGSALSALLYFTGLIFDNQDVRETGQMLAESMLWNGVYTELLKITFLRYRPYTGNTNLKMEPFEFEHDSNENSLPSGHTSTAFTIATVLSQKLDNTYASIVLYSLASLTTYQRVYADVHWFSDTFLGAALGTIIGLKISSLHNKHNEENKSLKYSIYPNFDSNSYKVGVLLQF